MDNAAFHKRQDIQDLLAQHGHQILCYHRIVLTLILLKNVGMGESKRKKWLVNSIDKLFSRFLTSVWVIKRFDYSFNQLRQ